jgi:polar amino acid transport system substrate-binding protein
VRAVDVAILLVIAWAAGISGQRAPDPVTRARTQLLPSGHLRVGINTGNRLTRIVGREIGTELGRRLNTDVVFVEFPSPGAVADAVGTAWDVAFIAADPDRESAIAFTPPYVAIEAAFLVRAASPLRSPSDVDRAGVRIATGATSAYTLTLKRDLQHAELVFLNADEGARALAAGTVEAMAGLRFDLMARAAGDRELRVLPESFARAQQAVAVPRANSAALAYVTELLNDLKRSGAIAAMIQRTGLPGATVVPQRY